jgi:hypothetical protein
MKKIILTLISIAFYHSANCQSIGLRTGAIFSGNKEMNAAIGSGLYLAPYDSLEKFSYILFGDYLSKKDAFNDCADCPTKEISTSYRNFSFGVSGLWSNRIFQKSKVKIGPLFSYNITDANRQGQNTNWIETYKIKSLGAGILFNLQFRRVFKLPLSFDFFFTPLYLIHIKKIIDPIGAKSDYTRNLTVLNLQFGLSYIIK